MRVYSTLKIGLTCVFFFALSCVNAKKLNKNIVFPEIVQSKEYINSTFFELIKYDNCKATETIGSPNLPTTQITFYIPQGQVVTDVIFKSNKQTEVLIPHKLIPVQHSLSSGLDIIDNIFDEPNPLVYSINEYGPQKQIKISQISHWDGDLQLVNIEITPIQYNPVQNKLIVTTDADISIITADQSTLKSTSASALSKGFHSLETLNMIKSVVINPQDIEIASLTTIPTGTNNMLKSAAITWTVPFYEYVIITSQSLKPSFINFATWQKRKGYNVGIVCIEDIYKEATGDELSPGLTGNALNAGKVRQYLKAGWVSGVTKYVLLGGDFSVIPVMYGDGEDLVKHPGLYWNQNQRAKIPSDHYYADFETNWTRINNGRTGSKYYNSATDFFDWGTEINVGRLLCISSTDIATWTTKILKYEQNPGNGDYTYLTKWLATQADNYQQFSFAESQIKYLPSNFTTLILNETPSYNADWPISPKGGDVIANLNQHYGMFCNYTHGGSIGFLTASHGCQAPVEKDINYGVSALDIYDTDDNLLFSMKPETYNGLDNLTNVDYPTIMFASNCQSIPFDDFGTPESTRNLAESFTCISKGGGPMIIGSTRDCFDTPMNGWFNSLFKNILLGYSVVKADVLTKKDCSDHFSKLAHNVIGCPEMRMWSGIPNTFSKISTNYSNNIVTVDLGINTVCQVNVMSYNDMGASYYSTIPNASGNVTFSNVLASFNSVITVTKAGFIPYLEETNNKYFIQNTSFFGFNEINVLPKYILIGNNVTPTLQIGNVVVKNGATVSIWKGKDLLLDKGFEVELGGVFY